MKNKNKWKNESFNNFNKNEYQSLIRALEKFEKTDYKSLSQHVKREEEEVKKYVTQMLLKIGELSEG